MLTPTLALSLGNKALCVATVGPAGAQVIQLGDKRIVPAVIAFTPEGRRYDIEAAAKRNLCRQTYDSLPLLFGKDPSFLDSPRFRRIQSFLNLPLKVQDGDIYIELGPDAPPAPFEFAYGSLVKRVLGEASLQLGWTGTVDIIAPYLPFWPSHAQARLTAAIECTGYKCLALYTKHLALGACLMLKLRQPNSRLGPGFHGILDVGEYYSLYAIFQLDTSEVTTMYLNYNVGLGAIDFDIRLADYFLGKLRAQGRESLCDLIEASQRQRTKLLHAIKEAKKILSVNSSANITLDGVGDAGETLTISVTQSDFVAMSMDLVSQYSQLIRAPELTSRISSLSITGGGSRIHPIQHAVTQVVPSALITKVLNPDNSVAEGLGCLALLDQDKYPKKTIPVVRDLCYRSIYILPCADDLQLSGPYEVFKTGDHLPARQSITFTLPPGPIQLKLFDSFEDNIATYTFVVPKNVLHLAVEVAVSINIQLDRSISIEVAQVGGPSLNLSRVWPDPVTSSMFRDMLLKLDADLTKIEEEAEGYATRINAICSRLYALKADEKIDETSRQDVLEALDLLEDGARIEDSVLVDLEERYGVHTA
ncbi:Heat shock protein 70 [Giardia muris]|uniref:Heat shock protein 70 n=1 Tax=Giardia muris TaxID=5742 RepID=A0A4Z1SMK9_GIAMU|nr:Heat shock protein 70 [Giardia muris]|eukprot:TNJ26924.1 Heat shock protein 70 [Giardia muris]